MTINEEHRQAEVAAEVEQAARTLAHSTRAIPNPSDSYDLLGEFTRTADHLEQVAQQLARWHASAFEGGHLHADSEVDAARANSHLTAEALTRAADALATTAAELRTAHSANAAIRWAVP